MENVKIGSVLIATDECEMNDGYGKALVVGKKYIVIHISEDTYELSVKSEIFDRHYFSLSNQSDAYWFKYFDFSEINLHDSSQ